MNDWYERNLGIRNCGKNCEYEDGSWWQDEGPTVMGAEQSERQVGGPSRSWRINFRARDLDAMVAQLRASGIVVKVDAETYPNGRFAHLHEPEGNSIELWQAGGTDGFRQADALNEAPGRTFDRASPA